ncbi:MAG TPA: class I SAM-dependent methyltransferase [Candidatus Eremiobacteraceae bacterium]|nr:class I SAM-dependent methyltransferase [Candidatus Eremiobacteraceae bacterium]
MLERRKTPSVPFYFPDWLVLRELSRDIKRALATYASGRLLDVGCGEKPYAAFGSGVSEWVGFDDPSNPVADAHGRGESMPFPDASFDTVLCTQVIEHVPEPRDVLGECSRVLRPGGTLIVTAPQYWEVHEAPHDYYRYTAIGLRYLLNRCGLAVIETSLEGTGPKVGAQALNLSIQHWGEKTLFGKSLAGRAIKVPLYVVNNIGALLLSAIIKSDRDALNLMMVGRKGT